MPKVQLFCSWAAVLVMSLMSACDDGAACAHLTGDAFEDCMSAEDESAQFREAAPEEESGEESGEEGDDPDDAVCKPKISAPSSLILILVPPPSCVPTTPPSGW